MENTKDTTVDPFGSYDVSVWNTAARLPSGIAALTASVLSFGLVVPCMDQVWFVGPAARTTGDIGFEVGFVAAALLYLAFRALEVSLFCR